MTLLYSARLFHNFWFTFHSDSIMTSSSLNVFSVSFTIYISLWFYYDTSAAITVSPQIYNLHFTLILLWPLLGCKDSLLQLHLHFTLILLWPKNWKIDGEIQTKFTFHSDSIMTGKFDSLFIEVKAFTFHSDSIMTNRLIVILPVYGDLHFTLILLWRGTT